MIGQVTDKTRADIKGGTLIQYEGKVIFLFWISFNEYQAKVQYVYFEGKNIFIISNICTLEKIF